MQNFLRLFTIFLSNSQFKSSNNSHKTSVFPTVPGTLISIFLHFIPIRYSEIKWLHLLVSSNDALLDLTTPIKNHFRSI